MTKIVIIGSLQHAPYEIIFKPKPDPSGRLSAEIRCQRAMDEAHQIWVVINKMGKHTIKDMAYAEKIGKPISYIEDRTEKKRTYLDRCIDPNCANSRPDQGCQYININITRSGHCGLKTLKTKKE